jgi:hypothetical protein
VVERDVGSERVDELGVSHGRVGERLFESSSSGGNQV